MLVGPEVGRTLAQTFDVGARTLDVSCGRQWFEKLRALGKLKRFRHF